MVQQIQWPHEDLHSLNAFYGDPRGGSEGSPEWQSKNLVKWAPPYQMFYSDEEHTPLPHLRIHKACVATFEAAFRDVLATLGLPYIKANRLDLTGGTYDFRIERGGSRLSVHSWGCAIDMDPQHNPFPRRWAPNKSMIDAQFSSLLMKHGFAWRGAGGDIDPMHFQLCKH